ncbi:retrovirus-related pol polyprotein from transposon TNT 1-94 [Tanacetum coccineum]
MYKLDLDPLSPKLLKNREAHVDYLKSTQKNVDILCEIIEQARALRPLDSDLDSTCQYVKRIQELLVYVSATCSNSSKQIISYTNASGSKPPGNTKKNRISKPTSSNKKNKVEDRLRSVKSSFNKKNHNSEPVYDANVMHFILNVNFKLVCSTSNECMFDAIHDLCAVDYLNNMNERAKSRSAKRNKKKNWKPSSKVFTSVGYRWLPTRRIFTIDGTKCPITRITSTPIVPPKETNLLKGSRGSNLYTMSLEEMTQFSLVCLLSKASKTKSWLWHRRLFHLNFGSINDLAKQALVRGLPKLKYQKDHLCSACSLGKSKKHTHKPKSDDSIQEKLYLLHMDLCGPMRIESINGKKYILVIVDDYSRFTWLKFLRSKDETRLKD